MAWKRRQLPEGATATPARVFPQALDLGQPAALQHASGPLLHGIVQNGSRQGQSDLQQPSVEPALRAPALPLGERPAGCLHHLERAQHTLRIARGKRFGAPADPLPAAPERACRVHGSEGPPARPRALPRRPAVPAPALRTARAGRSRCRPPGPAAPRAPRSLPPPPAARRANAPAENAWCGSITSIRWCRTRLRSLGPGFAVPIVSPAIGLQGVGADQLDGEPPFGKVHGQRHRERALAGGGRTKDGDHLPGRRGHGCRIAPASTLLRLARRPGRDLHDRAPAAGTVAAEANLDPAVEVRAKNPDSPVLHP